MRNAGRALVGKPEDDNLDDVGVGKKVKQSHYRP
jgi:hypothetical protein